ncbi:hypothetical protein C1645_814262 [Glomus cerebriforme]|uniref:Uncharacterized protein n=1 Tax=Glomus cerebriforme TaxID=658196 RepID=A0A397TQQ4_9GLOM|nr:hypothetical protein C1645_814262 [Glomus cerebriforme]
MSDSVLYKHNVENADRQDDSAAYWIFYSTFLKQVYDQNELKIIFTFLGELIDAYQSHTISHKERLRMFGRIINLVQNVLKIINMFQTHTNALLAKVNTEKTSAEGYIVNYYEDIIADNIHNLTTYSTDDEMHLIYDLNQDSDRLEEINKASYELNKISKATELVTKLKKWQNRKCLEVLERHQNAPALPRISVANITSKNPAKCDGYAFALLGSKICLVQFLVIYHKLSNYHSYIDSTNCIDLLSYISVCVYIEQIPNIFGCSCENFTENIEYLIVVKKEMAIYNFFKSIINKLQLIIAIKLTNGNAE